VSTPPPATLFVGTVVHVRHPRRETGLFGWHVIAVELDGVTSGLGSPRSPMTWAGEMPPVKVGTRLQATGTVETSAKWGEQLKVTSAGPVVEQTTAGIEAYLASGAVPGIGPALAKKIVAKFAEQTLTILDHAPERLAEVKGIKPGSPKLAKAIAGWIEGRSKFVAMQWFAGHGVSQSLAKRIVDEYGPRAISIVEGNPYQLAADVDGIGFERADDIARKLGMTEDAPERAVAALLQALADAAGKGHCFLPEAEMVATAAELIERPESALRDVLARLTDGSAAETIPGRIGGNLVSLGRLADAERRVAKRVLQLLEARPGTAKLAGLTKAAAEKAVEAFQAKSGMTLAPVQRDAVLLAATSPMMVITGGPGCGKTTILRAVLAFLKGEGCSVLLMSPTGKAAQRMAEVTGHPAKTIHSTLGAKPNSRRFFHDLQNPLDADVVVVDEASMLCVPMASAVVEAVALGRRLILVGDVDQLPSVAPGAVLHDLIVSGVVPTVRLTQVYRQAEGSSILTAAHAINAGQMPTGDDGPDGEFYLLPKPGAPFEQSDAADLVVKLVTEAIPRRRGIPFTEILVLTPQHKGDAGTIALNERLRAVLNPADPAKKELQRGDRSFREGDRVMQRKNDSKREVYNGDVGTIAVIRDPTEGDPSVMVVFFEGRQVAYTSKEVSHLQLAYAISIHKCVHPDTLVETTEGLVRIADIAPTGMVATPEGPRKYRAKVTLPEGDLLRIDTDDGYQLTVTPEHGVDVWREGSYRRIEARDIRPRDMLRLKLGATVEPTRVACLPPAPKAGVRARLYTFPATVSADVAEFLGLMVADGTVYRAGIRLVKRHADVVARFADLCRSLFGATPKAVTVLGTGGAEVNSTQIAAWCLSVGGLAPRQKAIPSCILRSPSAVQAAFLRGLFEDGSVHLRRKSSDEEETEKLDHIEWSTCYPRMAHEVRVMLLRLGIIAGTTADAHVTRLEIYGCHAKAFGERVGFVSALKNERARAPVGSETRYRIPLSIDEMDDLYRHDPAMRSHTVTNAARATAGTQVDRAISRHLAKQLIGAGIKSPTIGVIRERLGFHHVWVSSVSTERGPSVCVEVPDGHRFLQDGFCGWNSQGSESKAVIVVMHRAHYTMLSRPLLYTACTRGKKLVMLISDPRTIRTALSETRRERRNTLLAERLRGEVT